jgi:hypothetical protein
MSQVDKADNHHYLTQHKMLDGVEPVKYSPQFLQKEKKVGL